MSKDQKGFIVYGDIKAVIDELDDAQVAQLFRGMVDYFMTGKDPKFTGVLKFVWITIRQQMDRDTAKYEKKCARNRENAQKRWARESGANEYEEMRSHAMDANINTNTKTDTETKTNTNTNTTTNTNTKAAAPPRGGGECDDRFNLYKLLGGEGIDAIYQAYPESGGLLIQEVFEDVRDKKKTIKNPVAYVLGYAKKVEWDDSADHFADPWEA